MPSQYAFAGDRLSLPTLAQVHSPASVIEELYLTNDNKRCREALLVQIGADCRTSDSCVDDSRRMDGKDNKGKPNGPHCV